MKKILALVLTFALVLALVPMTAMAAGGVAKIGTTEYASLQEAVADAKDGDTIVITKSHKLDLSTATVLDSSIAGNIVVTGKSVTIDLNGKKLTGTVDTSALTTSYVAPFVAYDGGSLTLKSSVSGGGVDLKGDSKVYALLLGYTGGTLQVDSGSYKIDAVGSALIYSQENRIVTINDGDFTLGNVGTGANGSPWIFNAKGQNTQKIVVNGGSYNADIQHQYYPFEIDMSNTKALEEKNGKYTVVDAVAYTAENEWSSKWYQNQVGYATLEKAIAAAEDVKTRTSGKTTYTSKPEYVTLLETCPVKNTMQIGFDLTVNMEGNTILWTGSGDDPFFTVADDAELTIEDFVPLRNGYEFLGWYEDKALEVPYDLTSGVVPAGMSLYAAWKYIPVPATGDGMGVFVFAGLALVSLIGMAAMKKREEY